MLKPFGNKDGRYEDFIWCSLNTGQILTKISQGTYISPCGVLGVIQWSAFQSTCWKASIQNVECMCWTGVLDDDFVNSSSFTWFTTTRTRCSCVIESMLSRTQELYREFAFCSVIYLSITPTAYFYILCKSIIAKTSASKIAEMRETSSFAGAGCIKFFDCDFVVEK